MPYPTVSGMFSVVAPASTEARSTSSMKSRGVRVASWGLNSTSSVCSRARATPPRVSASTWASFILSMCSMCWGLVEMNTWMRARAASRPPPSSGRRRRAACATGRRWPGPAGRCRPTGRWPGRLRSPLGWRRGSRPRCSRRRPGPVVLRSRASRRRRARSPVTARRRAAWCRRRRGARCHHAVREGAGEQPLGRVARGPLGSFGAGLLAHRMSSLSCSGLCSVVLWCCAVFVLVPCAVFHPVRLLTGRAADLVTCPVWLRAQEETPWPLGTGGGFGERDVALAVR